MIMIDPDQNLALLYGSTFNLGGHGNYYHHHHHPMAEDESRLTDTTTSAASSKNNQEIRDDDYEDNQGWLQLSIGGAHNNTKVQDNIDQEERSRRLIELDLLPPPPPPPPPTNTNINSQILLQGVSVTTPMFLPPPTYTTTLTSPNPYSTTTSSPLLFQHPGSGGGGGSSFHHHQDNINYNWGFGSWPRNTSLVRSFIPSSSGGSNSAFQIHTGVSGSGIDFRVIDPPRQPHSGIWFMLQAAQNQTKEPYLPQISKSFLRIKDGRITIRLVQKYLVNKLKLENESEIEIRCRGQQVDPFLTVQHVRDSIWRLRNANLRETLTLLPNSSTIDHIMVLNYARSGSTP